MERVNQNVPQSLNSRLHSMYEGKNSIPTLPGVLTFCCPGYWVWKHKHLYNYQTGAQGMFTSHERSAKPLASWMLSKPPCIHISIVQGCGVHHLLTNVTSGAFSEFFFLTPIVISKGLVTHKKVINDQIERRHDDTETSFDFIVDFYLLRPNLRVQYI